MFVTNHVLSGVVIGRLLKRHPVSAFVVGVGSHLALDMVPHWGCEQGTAAGRELFFRYARRDGLVGLFAMGCAATAVDRRARTATVAAMAGATLLDADKPVMHFFRATRSLGSSGGSMREPRTSHRRAYPTRSSSE